MAGTTKAGGTFAERIARAKSTLSSSSFRAYGTAGSTATVSSDGQETTIYAQNRQPPSPYVSPGVFDPSVPEEVRAQLRDPETQRTVEAAQAREERQRAEQRAQVLGGPAISRAPARQPEITTAPAPEKGKYSLREAASRELSGYGARIRSFFGKPGPVQTAEQRVTLGPGSDPFLREFSAAGGSIRYEPVYTDGGVLRWVPVAIAVPQGFEAVRDGSNLTLRRIETPMRPGTTSLPPRDDTEAWYEKLRRGSESVADRLTFHEDRERIAERETAATLYGIAAEAASIPAAAVSGTEMAVRGAKEAPVLTSFFVGTSLVSGGAGLAGTATGYGRALQAAAKASKFAVIGIGAVAAKSAVESAQARVGQARTLTLAIGPETVAFAESIAAFKAIEAAPGAFAAAARSVRGYPRMVPESYAAFTEGIASDIRAGEARVLRGEAVSRVTGDVQTGFRSFEKIDLLARERFKLTFGDQVSRIISEGTVQRLSAAGEGATVRVGVPQRLPKLDRTLSEPIDFPRRFKVTAAGEFTRAGEIAALSGETLTARLRTELSMRRFASAEVSRFTGFEEFAIGEKYMVRLAKDFASRVRFTQLAESVRTVPEARIGGKVRLFPEARTQAFRYTEKAYPSFEKGAAEFREAVGRVGRSQFIEGQRIRGTATGSGRFVSYSGLKDFFFGGKIKFTEFTPGRASAEVQFKRMQAGFVERPPRKAVSGRGLTEKNALREYARATGKAYVELTRGPGRPRGRMARTVSMKQVLNMLDYREAVVKAAGKMPKQKTKTLSFLPPELKERQRTKQGQAVKQEVRFRFESDEALASLSEYERRVLSRSEVSQESETGQQQRTRQLISAAQVQQLEQMQISKQETAFAVFTVPPIPRIRTPPPIPPFAPPPLPPFLRGGGRRGAADRGKRRKQGRGYTPSLAASVFGFKSFKMPKFKKFTGLELRPIVRRRRR